MDIQFYIKDGTIRDRSRIVIIKDNIQIINPTEAMVLADGWILDYCCPLKVSEQRDIHPQCSCNGIADDFSEGKPLS